MTSHDNLNRMSASPGHSYSNDILGNRTNRDYATQSSTAMRHDWDVLNRAINVLGTSTGASYAYRADGQRVEKVEGATLLWTPTGSRGSGFYDTNYASNRPTSRYFYDGQMGFEDDYNPSGSVTLVNRYGLGARGIDRVERTEGSTTTYGYPLYDGHGNMRTTLARNGSGYTTGTFKTYDVWGSVRSGGDSGDPTQKYCASLGHVSDDESGLIYMRARYYEPSTGRFVSEDPACCGKNWFSYGTNDPVNQVDRSGKSAMFEFWLVAGFALGAISAIKQGQAQAWERVSGSPLATALSHLPTTSKLMNISSGLAILSAAAFALASLSASGSFVDGTTLSYIGIGLLAMQGMITLMQAGAQNASSTLASVAAVANYIYGLVLVGELISQQAEEVSRQ